MAKKFLELIKQKARKSPARVVFPETEDPRVLLAVDQIVKEGTANPILIGNSEKLKKAFKKLGLSTDLTPYKILDSKECRECKEEFAQRFFEMRREKGMTMREARNLMKNKNYFGIMMVKLGAADGFISGSLSTTAEVLHPALQIIKTKKKFHKISGFFFMVLENRLLLFADCAVNIEPNSHDLAEIAIDTAETAKRFGIEPRIAMLSFSTNGSTKHPNADRVREATQMIRYFRPDLVCDGEMQVDAALVPKVSALKFPNSKVPGNANILIFPSLEAANIAYKLVERLGKAHAVGPVFQGFEKPINDLSRGCSVDDIVSIAAITSMEVQGAKFQAKTITCLQ